MMLRRVGLGLALVAALAVGQGVIAGEGHSHGPSDAAHSQGSNVKTMAGIVMNMNHFPGDAEKAQLNKIASSSSSDAEKAIATALININHSPSAADKTKLQAIAADANAPTDTRDLAKIVANFSHQASAEDVARLKEIK